MTSSEQRLIAAATGAALFVALTLTPGVASAQRTAQDIETARELYNQGRDLREKGDLRGALEKLRAAHALGNTPLTGIELCKTYAGLKQPVEAREVCLGVARIPPFAQETVRSQEARAEAARVAEAEKPKIGALRIKLSGVPAGREALVLVDGAAIPAAALGESRAVNPGSHVITAKVGEGPETRVTIETHEAESQDVEVKVQAPPESAPQQAAPAVGRAGASDDSAPPPGNHNTLATVSFVAGGIAALIGVVGGVKAMSGESDLERECVAKQCGTELHDSLSSAKTWGDVSTAFFIISGVAVAGGFVALLTSPQKPARAPRVAPSSGRITPVLGLGGAGLRGSF